jgi:hypothetical protein
MEPLDDYNYTAPDGYSPRRRIELDEDEEIRVYLMQLDMLRQECERSGNFLKAQECVNRMREVNLRYAKKIDIRSKQANVTTKHRVSEEHKLELLTFTRMWEEKLREYDQKADLIVQDIKQSHMQDYRNQEAELRLQIMNQRPRFSKKVMDVRDTLEKYVLQRRYVEAEALKQTLIKLEQDELVSFDDKLAVQFEKKSHAFKQQYVVELRAAEQKITLGREELLHQRQLDFERLIKRHTKVIKDIEMASKLHVSKTRCYIQSQIKALVLDPLKTGMDLGGVERTFREGQGKRGWAPELRAQSPSVSSSRRARTPPASSVRRAGGGSTLSRSPAASSRGTAAW